MSDDRLAPWTVVRRDRILHRPPWMSVWTEKVRLPAGAIIPDWSILDLPDYAVVVALTASEQVITTRSYKHGVRAVCLGLPAGYIEAREEPLVAIRRELLEETGYEASEWVSLGRFTADANRGCGVGHLYLAEGARKVQDAAPGDLEQIALELHPLADLARQARNGEVAVLCMAAAIGLAIVARQEGWR